MFQLLKVLKTRDFRILTDAFKQCIRPQLEYASEIWNPYLKKHINQIEKVQKYFTRYLLNLKGIKQMPYKDRLRNFKLPELSHRRTIADLVMTQKIITRQTNLDPLKYYSFAVRAKRKVYCLRSRKCKKTLNNYFVRVIPSWNKLPNEILNIHKTKKFRDAISGIVI